MITGVIKLTGEYQAHTMKPRFPFLSHNHLPIVRVIGDKHECGNVTVQ